MSEIVAELRRKHECWALGQKGPKILVDAADEIERLRAALIKIRDDGKNCVEHCRHQARRALSALPPAVQAPIENKGGGQS